jgi:hypothetical protein
VSDNDFLLNGAKDTVTDVPDGGKWVRMGSGGGEEPQMNEVIEG